MSWRQYRQIEAGEFFLVGADCSQGGDDYNACIFLSKTKLDVPLIYHSRGVAAQMTSAVHPMLEKIYDATGVRLVVAFEQNNGGVSEMERLSVLNRENKYKTYEMPHIGKVDTGTMTGKLGYSTNTATRPILLGDWKDSYDNHAVTLYDEPTLKEHRSFIISDRGKPEAEKGAHDDLVFAHAIAWQLYQTEKQPATLESVSYATQRNATKRNKWSMG